MLLSIDKAATAQEAVRRPRPADAIGRALRGVFEEKPALPDDMMKMLGVLDQATQSH